MIKLLSKLKSLHFFTRCGLVTVAQHRPSVFVTEQLLGPCPVWGFGVGIYVSRLAGRSEHPGARHQVQHRSPPSSHIQPISRLPVAAPEISRFHPVAPFFPAQGLHDVGVDLCAVFSAANPPSSPWLVLSLYLLSLLHPFPGPSRGPEYQPDSCPFQLYLQHSCAVSLGSLTAAWLPPPCLSLRTLTIDLAPPPISTSSIPSVLQALVRVPCCHGGLSDICSPTGHDSLEERLEPGDWGLSLAQSTSHVFADEFRAAHRKDLGTLHSSVSSAIHQLCGFVQITFTKFLDS